MSEDDRSRPNKIASLDAARDAAAQHEGAGKPAPEEVSGRPSAARDEEALNPLALILGLVVVAVLVIGSWFLIQNMRCNPLFSDAGLAHSRACK